MRVTGGREHSGRGWWIATGLSAVTSAVAASLVVFLKAADSSGSWLWWIAPGIAGLSGVSFVVKARYEQSREPRGPGLPRPLGAPPHNVPVLGSYFTGRVQEHAWIEEAFRPSVRGRKRLRRRPQSRLPRVCVVYGQSGVGKSQLAVSYARRHLTRHNITWWLNASRPDTLRVELLELAAHVNIPDHESKNVVLVKLWNWLRANPGWLLVYDGVEPEDPVVRGQLEALLDSDGEVLITTRRRAGQDYVTDHQIELRTFTSTEGLAFLKNRTNTTDGEDAAELTALGDQLGWLPLALEQAAAHIAQTGMTVQEYLRDLPQAASEEDTLRLAIERITRTSLAAVDLLRLCAFLACEDIPRVTLMQGRSVVPEQLRRVMDNPAAFEHEVLLLLDHSLLTRTDATRVGHAIYGMHPRVQELIRERLDIDGRLEWSQAAVRLVEVCFPDTPEQLDSRAACERLMPHVEAVIGKLAWADETDGRLGASQDPEALVRLLHRVGTYQEQRCEWVRALLLFEQEAELCEIGIGLTIRRAGARLAVARQYYLLAALDKAEKECRKALDACLEHAGEAEFLLLQAQCQRQLGGIMRERNRFTEALNAVRTAVEIYDRQEPGWDSLDPAIAEQEIGMIHRNAGQLHQATVHYEHALTLIPSRGSQQPGEYTVFRAMLTRDFGIVAQDRGELETACRELTEALDVFREYRGPEDFETAQVAKFLADVRRRMGDQAYEQARRARQPLRIRELRRKARAEWAAADSLLKPVLELHRKRQETEAHKYASCLNKLGSLQFSQGRIDEARSTLEEAAQIYLDKYGPQHHYRAKAFTRLGPVLRAAGDLPQAEHVLREAQKIFKEALGHDHPVLIAVYEHLADCAADRGGHQEAAALRAEAARIRPLLWLD